MNRLLNYSLQDEFMTICALNHVYCCFLPAHTSHGLQPLDNGIFNVSKLAYRAELAKLATINDAAPVDKINFIRCYSKAREQISKRTILSGWRVTGNWPIDRQKALKHPECHPDKESRVTPEPTVDIEIDQIKTPQTARQIMDLAVNKSPGTRLAMRKIASAWEKQQMEAVVNQQRIVALEAEVERLRPKKRRKKVPNPNKRFMTVSEILAAGQDINSIPGDEDEQLPAEVEVVESSGSEEAEDEIIVAANPPVKSRSGRAICRTI